MICTTPSSKVTLLELELSALLAGMAAFVGAIHTRQSNWGPRD